MIRRPEKSERAVAELIAYLGRLARGDGYVAGLTPTQWTALRYFGLANRFSRTPSAFAEFHGTTRGTASQTIKSLIADGYLTRARSRADRRSARLDLTDKVRAILENDPFEALVQAAGALPRSSRGHIVTALERMLGHVAVERGKRLFGRCTSCAHLDDNGCCRDGKPSYQCRFVGEPLDEAELVQICINFEPGRYSAMNRRFAEDRP